MQREVNAMKQLVNTYKELKVRTSTEKQFPH